MDVAVRKLLSKAKPKLMSLLRLRSYYSKKEMFAQFKTHVLPLLESAGGAIYHAASSLLDQPAHVQHKCCRDMDTSDTAAFIDHNLAPLNMRRDIGLLGMLYKCAHRTAQPALLNLFPRHHVADRSSTRFQQSHSFHSRPVRPQTHSNDGSMRFCFGLSVSFVAGRYDPRPDGLQVSTTIDRARKNKCRMQTPAWQEYVSPRRDINSVSLP